MFKGGLGDIMQQAAKMQADMKRIQESLAQKTVEVTAGGGMVKVTATGKLQIVAIVIDPEVLKLGDREMLQDLVKAGVNEALARAQEMAAEEMKQLTAGLGPLSSFLKGAL